MPMMRVDGLCMVIGKSCTEARSLIEDCAGCDIYRKNKKPKKGCTCAKFDAEYGRFQCSVSGSECLFMPPSSHLCAEVYNEGPDAVDSKQYLKTVEEYESKYAEDCGIDIEKAREQPLVKAFAEHFEKILGRQRAEIKKRGIQ